MAQLKPVLSTSLALLMLACTRKATPTPDETPPPASATPAPAPKTAYQQIVERKTMPEAFAFAQDRMTDKFNQDSNGTILFAMWSAKYLTWSDVEVATNETSPALVRKDPDVARGKRMCASGTIVQITADKTDFGTMYEGIFSTDGQNVIRYLAVRSSGSLVERSYGRFCGVVTGVYDYTNSAGGTGHGVAVVGMFDLPENRPTAKAKGGAPQAAGARKEVAAPPPGLTTESPAPTAPAKPDNCDPPYVMSPDGSKHYKDECIN